MKKLLGSVRSSSQFKGITGRGAATLRGGTWRVGPVLTVALLVVPMLFGYAGHAQSAPAEDVHENGGKPAEKRVESHQPPLFLDIAYGYGLSYNDSLLASGWSFEAPDYYEILGIELSTNLLDLQLSGSYWVRENLGLNFTLPVGIVQLAAPPGTLPGLNATDFRPAIGEPSLGLQWTVLREDPRRPSITAFALANGANTRYSSLGDGFYGLTTGANVRRTVGKRVSLLGSAGYTHRFSRRSIEADPTIIASAGAGFLSPRRRYQTEVELIALRIGTAGNRAEVEEDPDAAYALSIGVRQAGSRHSLSTKFYLPDGKFGLKDNAIGLQYVMPLWPREPVLVRRPDQGGHRDHEGPLRRWLKRLRGKVEPAASGSMRPVADNSNQR